MADQPTETGQPPHEDKAHPYTDKGPANVQIGVDGNSLFPNEASKERKRRGNDRRFKGFPKKNNANHKGYDVEKIHKHYLDSPATDWTAYCALHGYNPGVVGLPWKAWTREKKYKNAWAAVSQDIEDAGTMLGPKTLLRALNAVKNVPETLAGMLTICHHAVSIHYDEVLKDQNAKTQWRLQGSNPLMVPRGTFSASTQDVAILAGAISKTSEMLYKSLGIDMSVGLDPQKWMNIVEEQLSQVDGTNETMKEADVMEVEVMGSESCRTAFKEALEKYLDRPRMLDTTEEDAELMRAIEGNVE